MPAATSWKVVGDSRSLGAKLWHDRSQRWGSFTRQYRDHPGRSAWPLGSLAHLEGGREGSTGKSLLGMNPQPPDAEAGVLLWWWGQQVSWPDLSESDSGAVNSTPSYPPGVCTDPCTHIHTHRLTPPVPTLRSLTRLLHRPASSLPTSKASPVQHTHVSRLTGPQCPSHGCSLSFQAPQAPWPAGSTKSAAWARSGDRDFLT